MTHRLFSSSQVAFPYEIVLLAASMNISRLAQKLARPRFTRPLEKCCRRIVSEVACTLEEWLHWPHPSQVFLHCRAATVGNLVYRGFHLRHQLRNPDTTYCRQKGRIPIFRRSSVGEVSERHGGHNIVSVIEL